MIFIKLIFTKYCKYITFIQLTHNINGKKLCHVSVELQKLHF